MKQLFNKDFLLLVQGQFVSHMGGAFFFIGMAFWIKENTGSATLFSMILTASLIPVIFFGPIGATLADRWSRKKIIIITDVIKGVVPILVAIWMILYPDNITQSVFILFCYAVISGVAGAFFIPAIQASVTELVPDNQLTKANGLLSSMRPLSSLLGQSLAGITFVLFGVPYLILFTGVAYLLSALSECFINIPNTHKTKIANNRSSFKEDMTEGVQYFKQVDGLVPATVAISVYSFLTDFLIIGMIYHVTGQLNQTENWYAYMLAGSGIGIIFGSLLGASSLMRRFHKGKVVAAMYLIAGIAVLIVSSTESGELAVGVQVIRGIAFGIISSWMMTAVQRSCSREIRGRVMGLYNTLIMLSAPFGLIAAGFIVDALNKETQYLFIATAMLIVLMSLNLFFSASFMRFMTGASSVTKA